MKLGLTSKDFKALEYAATVANNRQLDAIITFFGNRKEARFSDERLKRSLGEN